MRVKGGPTTRQRRKVTKKRVSGAWGTKHTSYKIARQTLIRSSEYAYRDRKAKKRDFRKLWNTRINSAVRELGYNYSTFINALHKAKIEINRKMLSELAISQPEAFKALVKSVMKK
ncbi:MAG: 50S ribosomal protein L20 [Mycoplasmataceae bacterium]|jgi:large subunit ribosomal protein L20|nr:50S ribosomal protein L20 [Mycoplasmataceae bacterium]